MNHKRSTLIGVVLAALFAMADSSSAALIHSFSSLTVSSPGTGAEDSGAGNVNNSAIGTDRRLIATFDVTITDNDTRTTNPPTTDAWTAIGFGFDDANATGSLEVVGFSGARAGESEFALLVRTLGANTHASWEDQVSTSFGTQIPGTPGNAADGIDGKVRITIDLSPAGILAGETASVKYEVDNNADGIFDDLFTASVDWEDSNNFVWFSSRDDSEHVISNFVLESIAIPAPSSLSLGLAAMALIGLIWGCRKHRCR